MNKFVGIVLLIFVTIALTSAVVCPKDPCKFVKCEEQEACNNKNQEIRKGGYCKCCDICYTVLSEGDSCFVDVFRNVPSTVTDVCGPGLQCYERKCIKEAEFLNKLKNKYIN